MTSECKCGQISISGSFETATVEIGGQVVFDGPLCGDCRDELLETVAATEFA
jgi:hypothetical protein